MKYIYSLHSLHQLVQCTTSTSYDCRWYQCVLHCIETFKGSNSNVHKTIVCILAKSGDFVPKHVRTQTGSYPNWFVPK